MSFFGKVWKVLVGVKDGLVLLFMLLFFVALFGILSARPSPGAVQDGALLIALSGRVVEEKSALDPIEALLSGSAPVAEYRARDLVRALDAAATDPRISAVVLDMTTFMGGGQVHLTEIGEAMERVRKAKKPVFDLGELAGLKPAELGELLRQSRSACGRAIGDDQDLGLEGHQRLDRPPRRAAGAEQQDPRRLPVKLEVAREVGEQARADQDRVRALAERDGDFTHRRTGKGTGTRRSPRGATRRSARG